MSTTPVYQTAPVSEGVALAYIDSWAGKPAAELPASYTTIIALHGVGCNAGIFAPAMAHLPADVRMLAYNQRMYAGSMGAFVGHREGGTDITAAYLEDALGFIDFAVGELGVPGIGKDGEGGVALLGWSKGTLPLFALLAAHANLLATPTSFLSSLPPNLLQHHPHLTTHLRCLILFEPPAPALGFPSDPSLLAPMLPVLPPNTPTSEQFGTALLSIIASSTGDASQLGPHALTDVVAVTGPEAVQPEVAGADAFGWALSSVPEEVAQLARGGLEGAKWPVGLVYGSRTMVDCVKGVELVNGWWDEAKVEGKAELKTSVREIDGGTHFVQVLELKEFVVAVVELLEELGTSR